MRRLLLVLAGLGLGLPQAETALAGSFRVSPVQLTLSRAAPTALLTITSDGGEPTRFQVSLVSWAQDETGAMQLEPSREVVYFPALFEVKGGSERKVRISTDTFPVERERTYRLVIQELPPAAGPESPSGAQVKVLVRMSVPVFVEGPEREARPAVTDLALAGGHVGFRVANDGTAHMRLLETTVTVLGEDGAPVASRRLAGWYVLAGGARRYDVELSPDECARARTIVVEAHTDVATVSGKLTVPAAGACAAGAS